MTSLADELTAQQARCRNIIERTLETIQAGKFLVAMLRDSLARAERATADGELAEMIRARDDLRSYGDLAEMNAAIDELRSTETDHAPPPQQK